MFAEDLLGILHAHGVHLIAGVPDSVLRDFCAAATGDGRFDHVIAANEGAALALAAGHHLATGRVPLVYLQNSGLANALNPYLSMCHPSVYDLPVILLVGWRGRPGMADEPQHRKVGSITLDLLRLMDMRTILLEDASDAALGFVDEAVAAATATRSSLSIVVSKGVLDREAVSGNHCGNGKLRRADVINTLLDNLEQNDVVFGGIGHVSRELYAIRLSSGQADNGSRPAAARDFLCVGGMGHAHQIAMGYAREHRDGRVWCLDGDGALLMHLGALSTVSRVSSPLVHVLFDNGVHASVGGQPVSGRNMDYRTIANKLGYPLTYKIDTQKQLQAMVKKLRNVTGPVFVWITVSDETVENLPRPKVALVDLKQSFNSALAR
ncbi:MAG TPA: phosphonopyruvate decarboxylase [Stellaceae bacterium]|nr:phosphonopyruvate decarboxylase [Stellaceae bacterium]